MTVTRWIHEVIAVLNYISARLAALRALSFYSTLQRPLFLSLPLPLSHTNTHTMSTEWSLDFCLVCDRQTTGGPYCSQSCRLAELDRTSAEDDSSQKPRQAVNIHSRSSTADSNIDTRSARSLSASSSQTSLSSLRSHASNATLSDQLQDELRDYASCFDPVRDLKRRLTTS